MHAVRLLSSLRTQPARCPVVCSVGLRGPSSSAFCSSASLSLRIPPASIPRQSFTTSILSRSASINSHRARSSVASSPESLITWTEYFRLRKSKKVGERIGGIIGGVLGLTVSGYYFFAVAEFDPTEPIWIFPDPSLAYGLGIFIIGGVVAGRDKEFFNRIQAKRPTEVKLSIDTPAPDYYGESVTSIKEYRAWLKKQRAYRLKNGDFRPNLCCAAGPNLEDCIQAIASDYRYLLAIQPNRMSTRNPARVYKEWLHENVGGLDVVALSNVWHYGRFHGLSVSFPGGMFACEKFVKALRNREAEASDAATPFHILAAEGDRSVHVHAAAVETDSPWGLDRIDQRKLPLDNQFHYYDGGGAGVDIYVVDTILGGGLVGELQPVLILLTRMITVTEAMLQVVNSALSFKADTTKGIAAGAVFGVAKRANVIAVKVLDADGHGPYSELIEGLQWVANETLRTHRPSVVNLSIQGKKSDVLNKAIMGLSDIGLHVTSAAGNMGSQACQFSPASLALQTPLISVGATDDNDQLATFSNYGKCVSILAPGKAIPSVHAESVDGFIKLSGTSMASPHVAGAVALVLSSGDFQNPWDMKNYLLSRATFSQIERKDGSFVDDFAGLLYL
ncbi:hypothetical protein HDU97_007765 [Phlyctochytrium planicorne]|nr:hypothetical protein HDU97_007765 [Phlyctochytrium planicorne]